MKNKISDGNKINVTLSDTISSGDALLVDSLLGVACTSGVSGDTIALDLKGEYTLPKATGIEFAKGAKAYWDNADDNFNTDTGNPLLGIAAEVMLTGAATGKFFLKNGI